MLQHEHLLREREQEDPLWRGEQEDPLWREEEEHLCTEQEHPLYLTQLLQPHTQRHPHPYLHNRNDQVVLSRQVFRFRRYQLLLPLVLGLCRFRR